MDSQNTKASRDYFGECTATDPFETSPMEGASACSLSREDEQRSRRWRQTMRDAQNAYDWPVRNPDAFSFLVAEAIADRNQRRKFSISHAVEEMRRKDFVDAHGRRSKLSNSAQAALARILAEVVPGLKVELNPSRFNAKGMPWQNMTDAQREAYLLKAGIRIRRASVPGDFHE